MKKAIAFLGFILFFGSGMYAINQAPYSSLAFGGILAGFIIMVAGVVLRA